MATTDVNFNATGGSLSRTRVFIALQFIVIVCLLFYSEEIVEMKQAISWAPMPSKRSSRNKNSSRGSDNHTQTNSSLFQNDSSSGNESTAIASWDESSDQQQVCQYQPDHKDCLQLFRSRLPPPPRRWAFFGDSTVGHLTGIGTLHTRLNRANMTQCQCQRKSSPRCNMYQTFGFEKAETWIPPNLTKEGPGIYGLGHPQCQDCSGCNSQLVECKALPCNASTMTYFSIEFARDVEIQTTLARTSQETVSLYLEQTQHSLQHPFTCVVSSGLHDMALDGITFGIIMQNMDWYLGLLRRHCAHLVYLQMTATLNNPNFPQQEAGILQISGSMVELLSKNETMRNWATIMDPFELSKNWTHADNIHMDNDWYKRMGEMFVTFNDGS